MSAAHRAVFRRVLRAGVRSGEITIADARGETVFGGQPAGIEPLRVRVEIHDPRAWRRLAGLSIGLAESYAEGLWDCDDLVALVRIAARDLPRFDTLRGRVLPAVRPLQLASRRCRRNTIRGSRQNIAAHYDLGNDLFATFLDESLTYSCAIFEEPGMTLAEAQVAKLDRICRKLNLRPDEHLLEIGTGWGALAIHAAREFGCRVTTATISREQHALATARVREAGLEDRVQVLLRDYRELSGRYDKLVSIEMIEAVGWHYFPVYFRRLRELVAEDGLALLQAITIDDRVYEVEKASRSFMNTLMFPGGCLPSIGVVQRCATRAGLRTVQLEDITPHYVTTLRTWRERFTAAAQELDARNYYRAFRRMWDFYLAYCQAGFAERRIQDVQVLLAAPAHRDEPLFAVAQAAATA